MMSIAGYVAIELVNVSKKLKMRFVKPVYGAFSFRFRFVFVDKKKNNNKKKNTATTVRPSSATECT